MFIYSTDMWLINSKTSSSLYTFENCNYYLLTDIQIDKGKDFTMLGLNVFFTRIYCHLFVFKVLTEINKY